MEKIMKQIIGRNYSIPLAASFTILFLIFVLGTPSLAQARQSQAESEGYGNATELCKGVSRDDCLPSTTQLPTDSDPLVLARKGEEEKYDLSKPKCCRPGCKWNCPEKATKVGEEEKYDLSKPKCCRPGCKWNCPEKATKVGEQPVCYVPPSFRPSGLKYPPVRQDLIQNIPL